MRKIINNKRYDTDGARELASDSYSNPRDFHHWVETLYRKRTGEYFLHGIGGPASKYAEPVEQNTWSGGEKIMPLSEEAARKWAEEHLDADEYEAIFGGVEDERVQMISMSVPEEWWNNVKAAAKESGKSATQYVIDRVTF